MAAVVLAGRALSPAPADAGSSAGTGNSGDWIVRCPMTGEVQAIDPIMDPGMPAPHVHMFFGNPDGTDNVQPTTTFADMNSKPNTKLTTCQDPSDTAAYWAPESFLKTTVTGTAAPYLPGCTLKTDGSGNYTCGSDTGTTIYIRAYYQSTKGAAADAALPSGLIMVAGTPDATAPPANDNVIFWDCGENISDSVKTPQSIWPYDCQPYRNDPNLNNPSGLVESINFPSCFNGKKSYLSPNGDGPGGDTRVPGYFDPSLGSMSDSNDLSYAVTGASSPCNGENVVPRLSMRIHYVGLWIINDDSETVYPSSCAQAEGLSEPCETEQQAYGTPGAPADIGLELSSSQTDGAPGPWYTEHADYWQTWQQGKALGPDPNTGKLNSLSYYCLVEDNKCGFMPNPNPKPTDPAYPPPPGQ
jgi:hypothetical protein